MSRNCHWNWWTFIFNFLNNLDADQSTWWREAENRLKECTQLLLIARFIMTVNPVGARADLISVFSLQLAPCTPGCALKANIAINKSAQRVVVGMVQPAEWDEKLLLTLVSRFILASKFKIDRDSTSEIRWICRNIRKMSRCNFHVDLFFLHFFVSLY